MKTLTILFISSVLFSQEPVVVDDVQFGNELIKLNQIDVSAHTEEDNTISLKSSITEPTFYLDANGITIKCTNCIAGDTGRVDGILYEAVDRDLLIQRKNEGADLSKVCTSLVTDMTFIFGNATAFNQPIGSWDVSNVQKMDSMFMVATSFNQNINNWDVRNVISMEAMFGSANSFNQNIGKWDVGNVKDMSVMFWDASSFNQDIGMWDVSKVTNMMGMFYSATAFNQNLNDWCVLNITTEPAEFSNFSSLSEENKPIWGSCPQTGDNNCSTIIDYFIGKGDSIDLVVEHGACDSVYFDNDLNTIFAPKYSWYDGTCTMQAIFFTVRVAPEETTIYHYKDKCFRVNVNDSTSEFYITCPPTHIWDSESLSSCYGDILISFHATTLNQFITDGGIVFSNPYSVIDSTFKVEFTQENRVCPSQYNFTYSIQNENLEVATCVQEVYIEDNSPPIITCPSNLELNSDDDIRQPFSTLEEFEQGGGNVYDDCSINPNSFTFIAETIDTVENSIAIQRTYSIADECGNLTFFTQQIMKDIETNIENLSENEFTCKFFPNPSNGIFTVDINGIRKNKVFIDITNSSGEQVLHKEIWTDNSSFRDIINLSSSASGVYFVKIINEGNILSKSLVMH